MATTDQTRPPVVLPYGPRRDQQHAVYVDLSGDELWVRFEADTVILTTVSEVHDDGEAINWSVFVADHEDTTDLARVLRERAAKS